MSIRSARRCGSRSSAAVAPVQAGLVARGRHPHDFYRPAAVAVLSASLDAAAGRSRWRITSRRRRDQAALDASATSRCLPGRSMTPDKTTRRRLFDQPYGIANRADRPGRHEERRADRLLAQVGHSHNAFFNESFIDELAAAAKQDRLPIASPCSTSAAASGRAVAGGGARRWPGHGTRRRSLQDGRAASRCTKASAASSAKSSRPRSRAAAARSPRRLCRRYRHVINPRIVEQQMESAVIFGLSAALYSRIDIEGRRRRAGNFPELPGRSTGASRRRSRSYRGPARARPAASARSARHRWLRRWPTRCSC